MRKLLLFIIPMFILACSDDENADTDIQYLNPPEWIHGFWDVQDSSAIGGWTIEFTPTDIISLRGGVSGQNEVINVNNNNGLLMYFDETIEDELYLVHIEYSTTEYFYRFELVDSQTINYYLTEYFPSGAVNSTDFTLIKQ